MHMRAESPPSAAKAWLKRNCHTPSLCELQYRCGVSIPPPQAAEASNDKTPLSPAAQAVLDAFRPTCHYRRALASALRTAADRTEDLIGDTSHPMFAEGVLAAAHLLDLIATELEATNV
jgi:hypothetical protein